MITVNDPIAEQRFKQEVALFTTQPVDGPPGMSDIIGHHGVLTCLLRMVSRGAPFKVTEIGLQHGGDGGDVHVTSTVPYHSLSV